MTHENGMCATTPIAQNIYEFCVDLEIWVFGLVNFVIVNGLRPLSQGKLEQSTHKSSPNMPPGPPSLLVSQSPDVGDCDMAAESCQLPPQ